ncbi:MAG: carboxymuconolactone decarboxylase family protein [Acidobacteria bacterium]|nr:carboxymuconolactone decarboxylase family protein [Acidobacteriota bacterium]
MGGIPKFYTRFIERYPDVGAAYQDLAKACKEAGPLDPKTAELVKLGISIGAGTSGATRSHTRKALAAGASHDEIVHAVLMATTTLGFPNMMRGLAWVQDVLEAEDSE